LPACDARPPDRLGARLEVDDCGPQAAYPGVTVAGLAAGFVAPLLDLGLLAVTGAEAAHFLHGQLTNDVEHLGDAEMRWYGYCTPKGRLLATLAGWKDAEGIMLVAPRPQAEPLRKRLSMYVLRSKAKVLDRSAEVVLLGVGGAAGPAALAALGLAAPSGLDGESSDGLVVVGMPAIDAGREDDVAARGAGVGADAGSDTVGARAQAGATGADAAIPRWLLAVPADRLDAAWATLCATLRPVSTTAWRWTEVRAGVPRIVAGALEQFVPQMINFEVVGGVNFRKGCYPGQEIVARSQYLGKLKRRMFAAHLDGPEPAPGSDVLGADGQPCGQVVLAAPAPRGGVDLLVESQVAAVQAGGLTAGGVALEMGSLPYALPA